MIRVLSLSFILTEADLSHEKIHLWEQQEFSSLNSFESMLSTLRPLPTTQRLAPCALHPLRLSDVLYWLEGNYADVRSSPVVLVWHLKSSEQKPNDS